MPLCSLNCGVNEIFSSKFSHSVGVTLFLKTSHALSIYPIILQWVFFLLTQVTPVIPLKFHFITRSLLFLPFLWCSSVFIPFLCEKVRFYIYSSLGISIKALLISYFLRRFTFILCGTQTSLFFFYSLYSYLGFVPYIRTCSFEVLFCVWAIRGVNLCY